ncbi:MAG: TetR/AcrR family transcriptional regulator [Myxococcota bacterium]|nr:TetR/AcrR family transcriptional regulator [Myxococcota bacterium]
MDLWMRNVRRGSLTRGQIIRAAVEIASREGLASVSLLGTARSCRLSTGAVQRHFRHLDDLRLAVIDRWTDQLGSRVLGPARRASNGLMRVWAMTEAWLVWSTVLHFPIQEASVDRALSQRVRLPAAPSPASGSSP